jgi:hypothetical protein
MARQGIPAEQVERARAVPIEHVIEQRGIKLRGKVERVGACPQCGGKDRFAANTKKGVFNCRGCGASGDVIALVEFLDGVDFITACVTLTGEPPKANGGFSSEPGADGKPQLVIPGTERSDDRARQSVREFPYQDAAGNVLFVVERREAKGTNGKKAEKSIRQKRPDPDHPGQWLWNIDGCPVVPYRLPQLIEAVAAGRLIVITEGEGKVDLLLSWGITATCNAGGAKKWKPAHAEFLRGADVILAPDNDNAGWQHSHLVGASLVGIAKTVRVLVLPGLGAKGDIIDWQLAGGTREQLEALLAEAPEWRPPSDNETPSADSGKAKAIVGEDALIAALAHMRPGIEFARARSRLAKNLGIARSDIDSEVKRIREDAEVAPLFGHWVTEPWPEPVDGDALLRDIIRRFQRHVIIPYDGALTIGLWLMMSWVHDEVATYSPILNVNSAEPESGKSTTMGLVAFLMPRCIASVEVSEAALYRAIERWQPSFCFDEFDSVLTDDSKAGLRSVINSGHTRGQGVLRCTGDDKVPELFSTFAPKAVGMVGRRLPPPTLSRCIFVELRRRRRDELIEKFKHTDDAELADLRRRLRRWSLDNQDALRAAKPAIPDELQNRREDNWRLQLAIADLCSSVAEDFGDKARIAAIKIEGRTDSRTIGVKLLTDIKALFDAHMAKELFGDKQPCITSAAVVERLAADLEGPWAEFSRGKPLTQPRLAKMLSAYGITSQTVWPPERTTSARGYYRHQFADVWLTYGVSK